MLPEHVTIRQLTVAEWPFYKAVRLKALQSDPNVFGSSYAREAGFADSEWQERLANADIGVFCAFYRDQPIGMTGIRALVDEPGTANLWGSWLENSWRGKGLSQPMYRARLEWAEKRPDITRIVVAHRESNLASKYANQKHGFAPTHIVADHVWNDGKKEAEVYYELRIKPGR